MLKNSICFTFALILSSIQLKAASAEAIENPSPGKVVTQSTPIGDPSAEEKPSTETIAASPSKPFASAAASASSPLEEDIGYKLTFKNSKVELEHCEVIAKLASESRSNRLLSQKLIDYAIRQDPVASAHVGFIHTYGDSFIPKNLTLAYKFGVQALRWLVEASNDNNHHAQFYLGHLYETGIVLERNPLATEKLYIKSAKKGFSPAQVRLAEMYEAGSFGKPNLKESDHWYTIAATNGTSIGNGKAQFRMGMKELRRDRRMAAHWFTLAHTNGIIEATYLLASLHLDYRDILNSDEEALTYAKDAAHKGCIDAMYFVGKTFAFSTIPCIAKNKKEDNEKEALSWFKAGADAGHPDAKKKVEYYQKYKRF